MRRAGVESHDYINDSTVTWLLSNTRVSTSQFGRSAFPFQDTQLAPRSAGRLAVSEVTALGVKPM